MSCGTPEPILAVLRRRHRFLGSRSWLCPLLVTIGWPGEKIPSTIRGTSENVGECSAHWCVHVRIRREVSADAVRDRFGDTRDHVITADLVQDS